MYAYIEISVGIPTEIVAHDLSKKLVDERVVAGTWVRAGTSHYRWDGETTERTYWTVKAYTTADHLDAVRDLVEASSSDVLPGLTYREFDAPAAYLGWIDEQTI